MKFSQLANFFVLFCHHSRSERPDFFGDFPFARENITFYQLRWFSMATHDRYRPSLCSSNFDFSNSTVRKKQNDSTKYGALSHLLLSIIRLFGVFELLCDYFPFAFGIECFLSNFCHITFIHTFLFPKLSINACCLPATKTRYRFSK